MDFHLTLDIASDMSR